MSRAAVLVMCLLGVLLAGCAGTSRAATPADADMALLADFAQRCPYTPGRWRPDDPPEEVNRVLRKFREQEREDHFPYLLEYGVRAHWKNLQDSRLAREMPLEGNLMLSELVRLAKIPKYHTAHEAGWLDRQFDNHFEQEGYSSYQVYVWLKEQPYGDRAKYPNIDRLDALERTIDNSGLNGLGGGGVCHYGCH